MTEHDFTPGRWAIYLPVSTYSWTFIARLSAMQIESQTPKLLRGQNGINHYGRQTEKDSVLFTAANGVIAKEAVQRSEGINGEMTRRQQAARDWAKGEIRKLAQSHIPEETTSNQSKDTPA